MTFRIRGLDMEQFASYVGLDDDALRARNARRVVADSCPGYPDRVELRDALVGETLLLVNYEHQPAASPFRASHAVYVLERAAKAYDAIDEVPRLLRTRAISLRAFDDQGMLVGAELCPGTELESGIEQLLRAASTSYLHLHYAKPGCYACRVDRV
jgi:uncharacterized protein YbaR (Trm112 family)